MRVPPQSYEELVARGVSPVIARFVTVGQHPIPNFDLFVRPIQEGWEYAIPADAVNVVGLWDENADAFARWTRGGELEFVQLYHDDSDHALIAWTEQGLLADLARRYYEFLNWHDEAGDRARYLAFCDYIGFQHAAALDAFLATGSQTEDFHVAFRSRFGRLPHQPEPGRQV